MSTAVMDAPASFRGDDTPVEPATQRGVHRLMVAVALGKPVSEALRMGDSAYGRMVAYLDELQTVDPERLINLAGDRDGFLRRIVRLIAGCLVTDETEAGTTYRTWAVVGNPNLTVQDVDRILWRTCVVGPEGEELSVWEFREMTRLLRDNVPVTEIAGRLGRWRGMVTVVANFVGYAEYRRDVLTDRALLALQEGVSAAEFAKAEGIGRATAYEYMGRARTALDEGDL